jgi:uncharacterized protein (DUF488 family)
VARLSPFHPKLDKQLTLFTLGTSNRSFNEFLALFKEHGIEAGVDIRSFPTSRFPHFKKESLQRNLLSEGIQYLYLGKELGGFRKGGYPAYMETDSFQKGLDRLEEMGREKKTAFFCCEKFPWKCHRRWISERLIQRGWHVIHIIMKGKIWIPKKEDRVQYIDREIIFLQKAR